ncbi:MAG TPA: SGNH/GDSL hydrolase family protein [Roseiarcus sp.]|nr:SGNH/GDSL hydrolase family protein [Roseiarcus sp.]
MERKTMLFIAAAAATLLTIESPAAHADGWIGSWGASDVFPVGPDVNFQTLRQFVRLSAGGKQLRVRFSNATGQYPLVIGGAAHVATPTADAAPGAIDAAADHALTFGGVSGTTVPPGAEVVSDPVEMDLPALSTVAISLFVPRWTGPSVIHLDGVATTYISDNGDFTAAAAMPSPHASTSRFFIDEVDVEAAGQPGALVTLGDSITDGYHSKVDANHRWPDRLAERLAARSNAAPVGVVNAGVSGNRILHDHPEDLFGPNALARLDRDVLSTPGLRWVVLMEGINDIGHSTSGGLADQDVTADQIIAGMKQIIARVHDHGAKIYGATLTPYEGTVFHGYYQPEGEAKREAVNNWIRKGDFDAVIDFDAAVRDPDHPTRMRAEYDEGDHLHPNDAGYRAMGDAVDLKLFE